MPDVSKSARTRQRLLDAAARLFRERGYANTRLTDIAEAAGMQAGSMYYYFSSREDLVLQILNVGVENAARSVDDAIAQLSSDASPQEFLSAAIRAHVRLVLETSDYASAHPRIVGEVPIAVRDQHMAMQRAYGDRWHALLADAQRAGDIDPTADLFVARLMLIAAMNSLATLRPPDDEQELTGIVEQAANTLLAGLARGASRSAQP